MVRRQCLSGQSAREASRDGLLEKLTNFVPGGGIWMNTQRPEWNDANNALVGTGISMVTLCYVHRFLHALDGFLAQRVEVVPHL